LIIVPTLLVGNKKEKIRMEIFNIDCKRETEIGYGKKKNWNVIEEQNGEVWDSW
jgi:hypothetical protein